MEITLGHARQPLLREDSVSYQTGSNEGDLVIDFFAHSGTTPLAGERMNRQVFTCDLDPVFAELTIRRLERFRIIPSNFAMPTTTLVRDLMQVGVPICCENTPLVDVARLLVEHNASALIVLDEDANMVGWIGEQHLAGYVGRDFAKFMAGDIMDEDVPEMPPDVPAAAAAHLMLDQGLRQVFISHHAGGIKYPAAVLTLQDVLRIIAGLERAPGVGAGSPRPNAIDLFKHRYGLA